MAQPWLKYGGGQPAPPAAPAPPPFIQGTPKPYAAAAEGRAVTDQQLQIEAAERARRDQALQEEKFRLDKERLDKENDPNVGKALEYQSKSAGFYGRMLQSEGNYGAVPDDSKAPRGLVRQFVHDNAPGIENTFINEGGRQKADQSVENFIAATLRLESGASIAPDEFARQYRIFYPMPGDGPEVIKQKAAARAQAIQGMKYAAGPLADDIESSLVTTPAEPGQNLQGDNQETDGLTGSVTDDSPDLTALPTGPSGGTPSEVQRLSGLDGDQSGVGGIMTLAKNGMTGGLYDEAAGLGGGISAFLTGQDPTQAYYNNRDAAAATVERARQSWPTIGGVAEGVGAFAGGGMASAAAPTIAGAAKGMGILGGATGFGQGRGLQDSVQNAMLYAGGGAALGGSMQAAAPYLAKGVNALAGKFSSQAPSDLNAAVVAAGERQGIPIRQPDAIPSLRGDLAKSEASSYGGPKVARTLSEDKAAVQAKVAEVGGPGNVQSEAYNLGQQAQGVGTRFIARTKAQAGHLYDKAKQLAGNATVQPTEAIAAIDRNIAELTAAGENANKGQISYLQGLREDMARPGGMTIESVQNLRTNMRGQLSERQLTATDAERRVGQVIDAANMDLGRELPQGAASALAAADKFYAERQDFIKKVVSQFNGTKAAPLSPEKAAERLTAMVRNKADYDRLSRFMKEATPDEAADFAATIAEGLGKGRNGEFGLGALATNIEKVPANIRKLMFGDDGAKALEDLQVIARAKSDTAGGLNNSRSGVVMARQIGLRALLTGSMGFQGGGMTGALVAPAVTEIASAIGQRRAARLLLNPDFTKWLRNAPNATNPQAIDRYFSTLTGAAARSSTPMFAADIAAFQKALAEKFAASPGRAAADENSPDSRRVPPQNSGQ